MRFFYYLLTLRIFKALGILFRGIKNIFKSKEEVIFNTFFEDDPIQVLVFPTFFASKKQLRKSLKDINFEGEKNPLGIDCWYFMKRNFSYGVNLLPDEIIKTWEQEVKDYGGVSHNFLITITRKTHEKIWKDSHLSEPVIYKNLKIVNFYSNYNDSVQYATDVLKEQLREKWLTIIQRVHDIGSDCNHCGNTLELSETGCCSFCTAKFEHKMPDSPYKLYSCIKEYEETTQRVLLHRITEEDD